MPSDDLRPKAESCCAVANCEQHSSNAILDGYNVSFHRFPDNLEVQTVWAQKCKRGNEWNPQSSSICSMHFKSECFDHDAELPGYVHSFRFLRENAVPTVNLPTDSEISNLQNNYRSGIGNKTAKKVCDVLRNIFPISVFSPSFYVSPSETPSNSMCNGNKVLQQVILNTADFRNAYYSLLKEYHNLKI